MAHFTCLVTGEHWVEQMTEFCEPEARKEERCDWFQMGGRWTGYFRLLPGATGMVGKAGLQTTPAKPGYADQARKGDIDVAATEKERSSLATFAVLKDGKWHERGKKDQGIWDTEFHTLVDDLPDDTILTVVDCHR